MKSIFGSTDAERKGYPVVDGALMYFPRMLAAIARHSAKANAKHSPGEPLHWARHKSTDHLNTALRHIMDHKMGVEFDGEYINIVAAGWRILAAGETWLELREGIDAVAEARANAEFKEAAVAMYDAIQRSSRENDCQGAHAREVNAAIDEATEIQFGTAALRHPVLRGVVWQPSDNCECDACRGWPRHLDGSLKLTVGC
jgi:hypothetical protein